MARWSAQFNLPQKTVHFRCRVPIHDNHIVCLVGSGAELGNWEPRDAIIMTYDEVNYFWSTKVVLRSPEMYRYRYFVCRALWNDENKVVAPQEAKKALRSLKSLREPSGIVLVFWESNIASRMIHTRVLPEYYEVPVADFAVRAYHYTEWTRGWVHNVTELRIRLFGTEPIQFFNGAEDSNLWVKCFPLHFEEMANENTIPDKISCPNELRPMMSRFLMACSIPLGDLDPKLAKKNCKLLKTHNCSEVVVSKFDGIRCLPSIQDSKGVQYTGDDFISFSISTTNWKVIGIRIELHEQKGQRFILAGYSFILPLTKCHSVLTVPIYSSTNEEKGKLRVDCLRIVPVKHLHLDMQLSFQNHWNWRHGKKSIDVAEHGMVDECIYRQVARVSENTLLDFKMALDIGVDYIHFEVRLTHEKIPVVFNDFVLLVSFLNRNHEREFYKMSVHEMTVDQLRRLELKRAGRQACDRPKYDIVPFPTLASCLATISNQTGFIIQVVYPPGGSDGKPLVPDYFSEDTVVDSVVKIVFDGYEQRKIVFTSTEPDICVLLQKKQNRFPVLFKTQASSIAQGYVHDFRTSSIGAALEFAVSEKLLGVYISSDEAVRGKSLVSRANKMGLVVFAGGSGSHSADMRKLLCRSRVNAAETCHFDFLLQPGLQRPCYTIPAEEAHTLYAATMVSRKGFIQVPRCSVTTASSRETVLIESSIVGKGESRQSFHI